MTMNKDGVSEMTRPIIGIENRTPQEVFDIMVDRFRAADLRAPAVVTEARFDAHKVAFRLRRSAEIQDGETKHKTGWADTSDRAELMREAATAIDGLLAAISVRAEPVAELEARAAQLRLRIQELRIDYPEAAERRRDELEGVEAKIAAIRLALAASPAPSPSFQMLMDAYIRGNAWAHENGLNADGLVKAAYDYADKTTSSAPSIPAGYRLVPEEPTEGMVLAGYANCKGAGNIKGVYAAMLAAAPAQQQEGDGE